MSGRVGKEYTFVCPECDESLQVNGAMKDALVENGCVICGTAVTAGAFTEASAADGS